MVVVHAQRTIVVEVVWQHVLHTQCFTCGNINAFRQKGLPGIRINPAVGIRSHAIKGKFYVIGKMTCANCRQH